MNVSHERTESGQLSSQKADSSVFSSEGEGRRLGYSDSAYVPAQDQNGG